MRPDRDPIPTKPLAALEWFVTGCDASSDAVTRALASVRSHLGMDVAYLSEFVDGRTVFRAVDAPGFEAMAHVGTEMSLQDVYCQHILDGRLPELMQDTADWDLAAAMPITQAVPIGSHVSIPVRRADGSVYGMFCCLSTRPNPSLNERDVNVMRMFSDVVAREVQGEIAERMAREAIDARIDHALSGDGFQIVYQPIFALDRAQPCAFEALCRFGDHDERTPDRWFADAARVGRQAELEIGVILRAVEALHALPETVAVSINASPETVAGDDLYDALSGVACERIVIELTEHATVTDYAALNAALNRLRLRGACLAVDDAGAGYSGLQHIVRLRPDYIKLDMSLTRDIDRDWPRRALATALVSFAAETGAIIVAEGIETEAECRTLRGLGVHRGQGFHLGRPEDLASARAWYDGETRQATS